jgi:hypothetical protein
VRTMIDWQTTAVPTGTSMCSTWSGARTLTTDGSKDGGTRRSQRIGEVGSIRPAVR